MLSFVRSRVLQGFCLTLLAASGAGCRLAQEHAGHGVRGGVELKNETLGSHPPQQGPRLVYVADFALDSSDFQGDQGVRGMLPERAQQGMLGQVGERLPHHFATTDPAARAREIVDAMATSLLNSLRDKGIPCQRFQGTDSDLPNDGWLMQGVFTEVGEGNRFKRAIIGFGQGASTMEVQVGISDLAGNHPREPFMVFGTVKDPSKMPGAAATMNPYVAAAKFMMEKNATGKDVQKTADQIIGEMLKYEDKIKKEAQSRQAH
jgi:hypothetical protein